MRSRKFNVAKRRRLNEEDLRRCEELLSTEGPIEFGKDGRVSLAALAVDAAPDRGIARSSRSTLISCFGLNSVTSRGVGLIAIIGVYWFDRIKS